MVTVSACAAAATAGWNGRANSTNTSYRLRHQSKQVHLCLCGITYIQIHSTCCSFVRQPTRRRSRSLADTTEPEEVMAKKNNKRKRRRRGGRKDKRQIWKTLPSSLSSPKPRISLKWISASSACLLELLPPPPSSLITVTGQTAAEVEPKHHPGPCAATHVQPNAVRITRGQSPDNCSLPGEHPAAEAITGDSLRGEHLPRAAKSGHARGRARRTEGLECLLFKPSRGIIQRKYLWPSLRVNATHLLHACM